MYFIVAIMTISGGLTSVMYTDAAQAVILVVGSAILTIMGLNQIGTYNYSAIKVPRWLEFEKNLVIFREF